MYRPRGIGLQFINPQRFFLRPGLSRIVSKGRNRKFVKSHSTYLAVTHLTYGNLKHLRNVYSEPQNQVCWSRLSRRFSTQTENGAQNGEVPETLIKVPFLDEKSKGNILNDIISGEGQKDDKNVTKRRNISKATKPNVKTPKSSHKNQNIQKNQKDISVAESLRQGIPTKTNSRLNVGDILKKNIQKREIQKKESNEVTKIIPGFLPRYVRLNYKTINDYSKRMSTLLYLEEQQNLQSSQSLVFTPHDFVLRRYQDPNLINDGFLLDLRISPALQRRFSKLVKLEEEEGAKKDSSGPELGGQNVIFTLDDQELWVGYVRLIPKSEKKYTSRGQDSITVAVKFYKWGFPNFPKNVHKRNAKAMFVSTLTNRTLRAISRLRQSTFVDLVLGKSTIEHKKSRPLLVVLSGKEFNDSQKIAVRSVLEKQITVIQGPPGAGKTSTIHEIILQLLEKKQFPIVVVAASNVAVDNIAEKMISTHEDMLLRVTSIGKEGEYDGNHPLASICSHNKFFKASSPDFQVAIQKFRANPLASSPEEVQAIKNAKKKFLRTQLKTQKVIFTTTNTAAALLVGKSMKFSAVVMDEATQSSEPSSLIPISLPGVKKLVLVGDQKQLSTITNVKGLALSLFERIIRNGTFKSHQMLDTQYRMHPAISKFSRNFIYNGKLKDGVTASDRAMPGIPKNPVLFWDTCGKLREQSISLQTDENNSHPSTYNPGEARAVENILTYLIEKKGIKRSSIGVITPYRGQRNEICSILTRNRKINPLNESARVEIDNDEFSSDSEGSTVQFVSGIMLASVDAFQGREKDFIIMSCVRSNERNIIGFLGDKRRLNVAITRAKYGLILVGDLECLLAGSRLWRNYLGFLEESGSIYKGKNFQYQCVKVTGRK